MPSTTTAGTSESGSVMGTTASVHAAAAPPIRTGTIGTRSGVRVAVTSVGTVVAAAAATASTSPVGPGRVTTTTTSADTGGG